MDPLNTATTFATLVGLLCNFRQEKSGREGLDHRQFIEWLEYHRHEELKLLIVNTAAVREELDHLLRSDHAVMLQKLDEISSILTSLMSRLEGFKGLASAMAPKLELSEQAVSILRQFINTEADFFFYENFGDGNWSLGVPNGEQFGVTEPRFIGDDLDKLVGLGLLTVELNSQGTPLYHVTRDSIHFLKAVDEK